MILMAKSHALSYTWHKELIKFIIQYIRFEIGFENLHKLFVAIRKPCLLIQKRTRKVERVKL